MHKRNNRKYQKGKKEREKYMSDYEADRFMEQIEKWDAKHAKHNFLERMERKLGRKERSR